MGNVIHTGVNVLLHSHEVTISGSSSITVSTTIYNLCRQFGHVMPLFLLLDPGQLCLSPRRPVTAVQRCSTMVSWFM